MHVKMTRIESGVTGFYRFDDDNAIVNFGFLSIIQMFEFWRKTGNFCVIVITSSILVLP
jgi:hypothetical protein